MPIIHPNILGDYDSGPFPPSSITTMADVRCSDGFSYGPLSVVSSLCTRAHVCVGRFLGMAGLDGFPAPSRAENAGHTMMRAPNQNDEQVEKTVYMLRDHGVVTGIPVDIHVWRMFCHLGWTSDIDSYNVEKSTRETESWFPHKYWGEMNELYAGLGQLLQSEKHRGEVSAKVVAKKTKNRDVIQMAKTLLSTPEYNK